MAGGSVYDYLHKQRGAFKPSALIRVAIDVSKGMNYLHQNNIIHRDLKTANLLMDENEVGFFPLEKKYTWYLFSYLQITCVKDWQIRSFPTLDLFPLTLSWYCNLKGAGQFGQYWIALIFDLTGQLQFPNIRNDSLWFSFCFFWQLGQMLWVYFMQDHVDNFIIYFVNPSRSWRLMLFVQVVKVADFGVARVKAQSGVMTAETGTYRWMAPEVILYFQWIPCFRLWC